MKNKKFVYFYKDLHLSSFIYIQSTKQKPGGGKMIFSLAILSLSGGFALLVSYFANNNFPKPLTLTEEKIYVQKMLNGDEDARQKLIERNLRLVAHIIKKFEKSHEEPEDLISIGTIGLIKAVQSYNPQKSTRLATYASRCIENEILMHFRARKKVSQECSLYEPLGTDSEGNEITLSELLGTKNEEVTQNVFFKLDREDLKKHFQNLTTQEKKVLIMRYGLYKGMEFTQKEIAQKLGISRSYVSRIEKKAINHLNQYFEPSNQPQNYI